ncbi:MAG: Uma2 family endonuclease [Phycisphaerales bacterium]|nr:Uma2 family endonuclease [Phycisphaerales bacterium]
MSLPDGTRAELIDGELLMSPSPRTKHQDAVLNLASHLREYVRGRVVGRVFVAPLDVHLPSGDIVEPDILFVSTANQAIVQDWVRGSPDLMVEVLSPEGVERDRIVKRDLYARNGVREYWIVDADARAVEVFTLRAGRYEPNGYFKSNDVLLSPSLAEFKLPVAQIFAEYPAEPGR